MSEQDSAQNCPGQFENETPLITFQPAPLRPRHDGWTAERQIAFIEALAETGCVEEACRRVGVTRQSAYRLRRRESARAFANAWDHALDHSLTRLEESALERALNGVPRPIFHKGEQVGEWRHYDERLTMFLLRARHPRRFGKWMDRMLAPDPPKFEPSYSLADALVDLELHPLADEEDEEEAADEPEGE